MHDGRRATFHARRMRLAFWTAYRQRVRRRGEVTDELSVIEARATMEDAPRSSTSRRTAPSRWWTSSSRKARTAIARMSDRPSRSWNSTEMAELAASPAAGAGLDHRELSMNKLDQSHRRRRPRHVSSVHGHRALHLLARRHRGGAGASGQSRSCRTPRRRCRSEPRAASAAGISGPSRSRTWPTNSRTSATAIAQAGRGAGPPPEPRLSAERQELNKIRTEIEGLRAGNRHQGGRDQHRRAERTCGHSRRPTRTCHPPRRSRSSRRWKTRWSSKYSP